MQEHSLKLPRFIEEAAARNNSHNFVDQVPAEEVYNWDNWDRRKVEERILVEEEVLDNDEAVAVDIAQDLVDIELRNNLLDSQRI